jgi:hypothetical protein
MARKLTDTQLSILSSAAARDDRRVLPLPKLKAPPVAVQKTLKSLLADGLIEEIAASRDDETWDQSEERGRQTLIVTTAGLAAIGIDDETAGAPRAKSRTKPVTRPPHGKKASRAAKVAKKASRAQSAAGGATVPKQDAVIALLRRGNGASIAEMMEATGWQAHSVRGFMSGALKKRLGLELVSEKNKKTGERRYYVAAVKSGDNAH